MCYLALSRLVPSIFCQRSSLNGGLAYACVVFFALLPAKAVAQDTLVFKTGERLTLKVTEIYLDSVRGYAPSFPDSMQTFLSRELLQIDFANGTTEIIEERYRGNPSSAVYQAIVREDEWRKQGIADADLYYKGTGALVGTWSTTALVPPVGLLTGLTTLAIPPNVERQIVQHNPSMIYNDVYISAYRKKIRKKKLGKVAGGFGLGIASFVVLVGLLSGL